MREEGEVVAPPAPRPQPQIDPVNGCSQETLLEIKALLEEQNKKEPNILKREPVISSLVLGAAINGVWMYFFGDQMPEDVQLQVALAIEGLFVLAFGRAYVTPVAKLKE